ncbi:MAG: hypothetical protein WDO71_03320 [Bacteroidota bacterium]
MVKRKNPYTTPGNLFFILLLFSRVTVFSQTKETDSLRLVLDNHKNEDTGKVNTLNALALAYRSNDADTAMYFAAGH